MALIVISGFPSSGKSFRATEITSLLGPKVSQRIVTVASNASPDIYRSVPQEKIHRLDTLAAVKRDIGAESVVIVDEGNYIKGFRYQLFCEARTAGVRCCVVCTFTH
jgi:protein KTI12